MRPVCRACGRPHRDTRGPSLRWRGAWRTCLWNENEGAGGRGDRPRRADEGEEFEDVQRAETLQPAAPSQRRHMADQRGVFGQDLAEGLGAELLCALAGRTPPQAALVPDQGGRCVDGQAFGAVEQVKHGESFMRFVKAWTAVVSMPEMCL